MALIGIIEKPQFDYKRGWVRFEIQPEIYNAVLNFSKGFRKYELKTAMEFTSQYSMRFYELMSGQQTPLTYTIEDLKIMFGVQNKYKRSPNFIKWIVTPAKEELDAKSPYSFEYKILKDGRSFHALKLYPKYQPEHRDEELEKHELQKQVSLGWDLDRLIRNYLKQDLLLVSAEATGLSKPMEAIIDKIETFMKQTLVTVTYTQPNILSGFGGCFVDAHTKLLYKKIIFFLFFYK